MTIHQIENRVKLNKTFSSRRDIEYVVLQGSTLGPLLFNIHLCDLFYFLDDLDIAGYANDTTLYTVKENKILVNALDSSSQKLFKWFNNNFMKAYNDQSHLF